MRVWIVIPAYNEARQLAETLRGLLTHYANVIVVDDGSADETLAVAQSFPVHCLRHACNLGQGAALQTGIAYALRQKADIVVTFDADGQHRPDDIARLIQPIVSGEYDAAFGSRFLGSAEGIPALRQWVVRLSTGLFCLLHGVRISDANCGLRAFSRHAAQQLNIHMNRMAHTLEIIQQVHDAKLRYTDLPVTIRYTDYSLRKGQKLRHAFGLYMGYLLRRL